MAKYAWQHPWLFLDIWGRPIPTAIFSLVAWLGLLPTKLLTIFISLVCAFLTYQIAKTEKLQYSEFVIPFLIFQPYYLLLSVNPLTEIIFATILAVSILYLLRRNYLISATIASFLPLARPEGFFFLILWTIILIYRKKWWTIPLLGLGIFLWNFLGFLQTGDIIWLYHNFPWFGERSFYGSGNLFHFIFKLPEITRILLPLFLSGVVYLIVKKKFIYITIFLYFFILHTILWKFGLFKSGGYARYFVSVAPIIALISLYGYNFLDHSLKLPRFIIIYLTIVLILFSVFKIFTIQNPTLGPDHKLINEVYQYYKKNFSKEQPIICASNYFFYISHLDRFDFKRYPFPNWENVKNALSNTLIMWDSKFFGKQCDITSEAIINLGYKEITSFTIHNPYYNDRLYIKP